MKRSDSNNHKGEKSVKAGSLWLSEKVSIGYDCPSFPS